MSEGTIIQLRLVFFGASKVSSFYRVCVIPKFFMVLDSIYTFIEVFVSSAVKYDSVRFRN